MSAHRSFQARRGRFERVHEPSCRGHAACGGWYRCRICGKRCGWCRGESWDQNTCPECWPGPPKKRPLFNFKPLVRAFSFGANGRIEMKTIL